VPRVKQVRTADEYPYARDSPEIQAQIERTFTRFTETAKRWAGPYKGAVTVPNSWAQIFNLPKFGELMLDMTDFVLNDLQWGQRTKLRELVLLSLYERQRCDYGYRAHLAPAAAAGITELQISELPVYRTSGAFDEEERDVIEFANAAFDNHVSDELFKRLADRYGEQEVIEMAVVVGFWAFWGVLINTLQPDFAPVHGAPPSDGPQD
jgi:alkylhydroperoxidase family enzyme